MVAQPSKRRAPFHHPSETFYLNAVLPIIEKTVKKPRQARLFSVLPESGKSGSVILDNKDAFFWDAPYRFKLMIDHPRFEGMIAGVGFTILSSTYNGHELRIRQLQGVVGRGSYLARIDWETALIQTCIEFARERSMAKVTLRPAEFNKWYYRPQIAFDDRMESDPMHQTRFRARYDGTAERLGFSRSSRRHYFSFIL